MTGEFRLIALVVAFFLSPDLLYAQSTEDIKVLIRQRDYVAAAELCLKLAEAGDAEAAYQLASMYRSGRGVEKDTVLFHDWMLNAAEAGHANAQFSLGQPVAPTVIIAGIVRHLPDHGH